MFYANGGVMSDAYFMAFRSSLTFFFMIVVSYFANSICLSLPFSVLVFILFVVGFREQLWKAHIYTLKYAEKQLSPKQT